MSNSICVGCQKEKEIIVVDKYDNEWCAECWRYLQNLKDIPEDWNDGEEGEKQ